MALPERTSQAESLMMHGSIKPLLQDLKNPNKAIHADKVL